MLACHIKGRTQKCRSRAFENRVLGRKPYLDLRRTVLEEGGENCTLKSDVSCVLHKVLLGRPYQGE
jgi:hypothetical protein